MAEKEKKCPVCRRELYDEKYCIFHSPQTDKDAKLFLKKLDEIFQDKSLEVYEFSHFIFPEGISFPREIDKRINFWLATFQGDTPFVRSTFQDRADFTMAIFKGEAIFSRAVFEGEAYFSDAVFEKEAKFEGTTFKGRSAFWGVTFKRMVTFESAVFEEVLEVNEEEKTGRTFSNEEVNFTYVHFLKPEKVSFQKVDLSKFRFLGTDLRKVEFVNVDWYKKKKKGGVNKMYRGVNQIYDEIEPDPHTKQFNYPLIAQVYKRLRANYEENLNYAEAGDFHIGEMECKRKNYRTLFGRNLFLTALFKYVSNYGEGYRRTFFCWILPILLLFPILFMYSGIKDTTQTESPYLIDYDFDLSSISLNKAGDYWKDYRKSFVYSLSVFSLVREKQYRPVDNWGHFWMVSESILSPVLISLFLLALRRRFRR